MVLIGFGLASTMLDQDPSFIGCICPGGPFQPISQIMPYGTFSQEQQYKQKQETQIETLVLRNMQKPRILAILHLQLHNLDLDSYILNYQTRVGASLSGQWTEMLLHTMWGTDREIKLVHHLQCKKVETQMNHGRAFFLSSKVISWERSQVLLWQTFLLSFCLIFWPRLEDPDSRVLTHTPIFYPSEDCFPLALLENNNKVHWPSSLDLSPNMPYHQGFYAIFTLISPFFLLLFFLHGSPI